MNYFYSLLLHKQKHIFMDYEKHNSNCMQSSFTAIFLIFGFLTVSFIFNSI